MDGSPGKSPAPFLDSPPSGRDDFQVTISMWIREVSAADPRSHRDPGAIQEENRVLLSSFFTILAALFDLSVDPYPEVATMARMVVDYIMALLVESAFAKLPSSTLGNFPRRMVDGDGGLAHPNTPIQSPTPTVRSRAPSLQSLSMSQLSPAVVADLQAAMPYRRGSLQRSESSASSATLSSLNLNLKRTASFAASLKSLATGVGPSTIPSEPSSPATPITTNSFSHITDLLPGAPIVPEPHVVYTQYQPPWSPEAVSKSLPTPATTPPPTSKDKSDYLSVQNREGGSGSGIKLSPSWSSLSPPHPSFAPSTLAFPTKKGESPRHQSSRRSTTPISDGREQPSSSSNILDKGNFTAFDVICALVAEDLERQQGRQAQYVHGHPHHPHVQSGHGHGGMTGGTASMNPLALGRIDTIADLLPLRSTLFDSCAEYYSEPQMKVRKAVSE